MKRRQSTYFNGIRGSSVALFWVQMAKNEQTFLHAEKLCILSIKFHQKFVEIRKIRVLKYTWNFTKIHENTQKLAQIRKSL